jgi:nucleotide-binding universal stress UspA family protein
MFRKILLAYDGSEPARKAFDQCLEMAGCFGAQLSIVTVVRPPEFAEDVETEAVIETARARGQSELGKLLAQARAAGGVAPAVHIRVGHPAEQIIAAAEDWGADLIVTGHRGRGLFERWLLGSVSRVVIAYARCAVLVIR